MTSTPDNFKKKPMLPVNTDSSGKSLSKKKKREITLLDEDSVDYVPIKENTSAKKMKLTERQIEKLTEKRDKLPFMDEDSQNSSSILRGLRKTFDIDSSNSVQHSTINTNSKMSADAARELILQDNIEFDDEEELFCEDARPPLILDAVEDDPKRKISKRLDFGNIDSDVSNEVSAGDSKLTALRNDEEDDDDMPLADLKAALGSGSTSQDEARPRNRKNTLPVKYTPSPRRSINAESEKKKRGRPRRSELELLNEGKKIEIPKRTTPFSQRSRYSNDAEEKSIKESQNKTAADKLNKNEDDSGSASSNKTEERKNRRVEDSNFVLPPTARDTGGESAIRKNNEAEEESSITTPAKGKRREEIESVTTPGILKKLNSPTTAERKQNRVHFHPTVPEESPKSSKKPLPRATPRRLPCNDNSEKMNNVDKLVEASEGEVSPVPTDDDGQSCVYPALVECKDAISHVINDLLVNMNNNAASMILRKLFSNSGIKHVGDLAKLSEKAVLSLPLQIKNPKIETVKNALHAHHARKIAEEITASESASLKMAEKSRQVPSQPQKEQNDKEPTETSVTDLDLRNVVESGPLSPEAEPELPSIASALRNIKQEIVESEEIADEQAEAVEDEEAQEPTLNEDTIHEKEMPFNNLNIKKEFIKSVNIMNEMANNINIKKEVEDLPNISIAARNDAVISKTEPREEEPEPREEEPESMEEEPESMEEEPESREEETEPRGEEPVPRGEEPEPREDIQENSETMGDVSAAFETAFAAWCNDTERHIAYCETTPIPKYSTLMEICHIRTQINGWVERFQKLAKNVDNLFVAEICKANQRQSQ